MCSPILSFYVEIIMDPPKGSLAVHNGKIVFTWPIGYEFEPWKQSLMLALSLSTSQPLGCDRSPERERGNILHT